MDELLDKIDIYAQAALKKIRSDLKEETSGSSVIVIRQSPGSKSFDFVLHSSSNDADIDVDRYHYGLCCVLFDYLLKHSPSLAIEFYEYVSSSVRGFSND